MYWFGPFTPYFHALFFRVFGSSFRTLVIAGACGAAAVLACLHFALSRVTGRREAWGWTIAAIPLLVFMPNAGGAILGMGYRMWHAAGFGLLAIALASGSLDRSISRRERLLAAGILAGLAGLCRTEWGIAALVAAAVAAFASARGTAAGRMSPVLVAAGFLVSETAGVGLFVLLAGPAAVLRDAPVLLIHLPPEISDRVGGTAAIAWSRGLAQMAYAALTLVAAFLAIELLVSARIEPRQVRPRFGRFAAVLLLLVVCAVVGGSPVGALFSGAPLLCAAAVLVGLRASPRPEGAALAGFGTMGVLSSHRRFFFLTDGPYVAPPLLFALVCVAGWAALAIANRPLAERRPLSAALFFAVVLCAAAAFAGRIAGYGMDDRVEVPGTHGMLAASPAVARQIQDVLERVVRDTPQGSALVVIPEGEVLNFLTSRRNPLRHKLYLPGYVTASNEAAIVNELSKASPGAIVIWPRPVGEYGKGFFGSGYGGLVQSWIDAHYDDDSGRATRGNAPRILIHRPAGPVAKTRP